MREHAPSRRWYRAGRLVKVIGFVACFLLYPHMRRFPQLIFLSWRWRGLPRSLLGRGVSILVPMRHRHSLIVLRSPVGSYQRFVRRSVSSLRLGVPFPLSCPLSLSASSWERSVSFAWRVLSLSPICTRRFSQLDFPSVPLL